MDEPVESERARSVGSAKQVAHRPSPSASNRPPRSGGAAGAAWAEPAEPFGGGNGSCEASVSCEGAEPPAVLHPMATREEDVQPTNDVVPYPRKAGRPPPR